MKKRKHLIQALLYVVTMLIVLTGCNQSPETNSQTDSAVSEVEIIGSEDISEDPDTSVANEETFRMLIDDAYYESVGSCITGTIESGSVCVNDRVEVIKDGTPILGTVLKVEILGEEVEQATAGDKNVAITVENISQSKVKEGTYLTTASQEALDAEQALLAEYASVLHPPITDDDYEINITNGEYLDTIFCTINNIEFVIDYEFGNHQIHIEAPEYSDSRLAGFKATLTNTSDVTYNPGNGSFTVWSYDKSSFTPGGPYDGKLYVVKDGDLLENVEVAPGETVEIYVLGEMNYDWHEKYADTMYVSFYILENFENKETADSQTPEYSFYVRDFNK